MLAEFAEVAESLDYSEPKIPIVSNVSGELLGPEQATDPAYWVRHAREPVRFADAVATLHDQGASAYLELGPDPVLCAMAQETLGDDDDGAAFVPTLREGRAEGDVIGAAIAQAHASGAKLNWGAFFAGTGAKRVALPTYPFQRKRYWLGVSEDTGDDRGIYRVQWQPVPAPSSAAIESAANAPEQTIEEIFPVDGDIPEAAQASAERVLALLQDWAKEERPEGSRLTILTHKAIAAAEDEAPDLATAAVWGLVRSAISEHPGRFALIDTDGTEASTEAMPAALAIAAEEPQLALREGELLAPRLIRVKAEEQEKTKPIDPERTVLISGGTSGLGALVARHLTERHGARHLLLVSRKGPEANGAAELKAELEELGAEAQIAACDVSDPKPLEQLFASIPKERPLGAIVHSAGAIADGTIESLDAEQIERVFAHKP